MLCEVHNTNGRILAPRFTIRNTVRVNVVICFAYVFKLFHSNPNGVSHIIVLSINHTYAPKARAMKVHDCK